MVNLSPFIVRIVFVCVILLGPRLSDFWQALLFSAVQLHVLKNSLPV